MNVLYGGGSRSPPSSQRKVVNIAKDMKTNQYEEMKIGGTLESSDEDEDFNGAFSSKDKELIGGRTQVKPQDPKQRMSMPAQR